MSSPYKRDMKKRKEKVCTLAHQPLVRTVKKHMRACHLGGAMAEHPASPGSSSGTPRTSNVLCGSVLPCGPMHSAFCQDRTLGAVVGSLQSRDERDRRARFLWPSGTCRISSASEVDAGPTFAAAPPARASARSLPRIQACPLTQVMSTWWSRSLRRDMYHLVNGDVVALTGASSSVSGSSYGAGGVPLRHCIISPSS
jgi:hypothetical protein